MRYRAVTQVKGLSPETSVIPVAEAFPEPQAAFSSPLREVMRTWRGRRPRQGIKGSTSELGETQGASARIWADQPSKSGKEAQMVSWGSDQLIVVVKQGNACGARGLAGRPRSRDTSSGLRTGPRKSTELDSMTHPTEGEEVLLKSRMRGICKSGSVRGLVVDSRKRVGHEAYSTTLLKP